jgi:hypothetical protein
LHRGVGFHLICSLSGKLFNHKGCIAECNVGSDYQRRGIKKKRNNNNVAERIGHPKPPTLENP